MKQANKNKEINRKLNIVLKSTQNRTIFSQKELIN